MIDYIKLGILAAIIAGSFGSGWFISDWHNDSVILAQKEAQEKALQAFKERESQVAKNVNDKLAELKSNERTRTIKIPEIIREPVFKNVCISEAGVTSINDAINSLRINDKTNK